MRKHYIVTSTNSGAAVHHIDSSKWVIRSAIDSLQDGMPLTPAQKVNPNVASTAICDESGSLVIMLMTAELTGAEISLFIADLFVLSEQQSFTLHDRDVAGALQITDVPKEVYLRMSLPCERRQEIAAAIATLPEVLYMEYYADVHVLNAFAIGICQTDNSQYLLTDATNLTGRGHIMGIADTGLDTNSCFFYDDVEVTTNSLGSHRKVAVYLPYMNQVDEDGHGTHVTGSAVGTCSNPKSGKSAYDGVLHDTRVAFMDIGYLNSQGASVLSIPPNINTELYQQLYNFGSRVLSMSWGAETNDYTLNARNTDAFMYNNKDAIVFVAAGNSGDEGAGTVNSPGTAKNAVTVGASMNSFDSFEQIINKIPAHYDENSVAWFSSQGPTADGRIKPDILAPGLYIASANAKSGSKSEHCGTRSSEGTSSSTPLAAAHAVLIREYFLEGYYPTGHPSSNAINPSGALLKAMLIASAQEMSVALDGNNVASATVKGDNVQGYGRIQLDKVLTFENNTGLFAVGAADASSPYYAILGSFEQHEYNFTAITNGDVVVVLAYTDYPASTFSSTTLINDLDLKVSNGTDDFVPLSTSAGSTDTKNNVEVVVIRNVTAGSQYSITVSAKSLSFNQDYALVARGNIVPLSYTAAKPSSNSTPIGLSYRAKAAIAALCSLSMLVVCCMFWLGAYSCTEDKEKGPHSGNFETTFQRARSMLSRAGSEMFDIEMPAKNNRSFSRQESTSDASVAVEGGGTWRALKRVERSFLRGIEVAEVAVAQPIEKLTFQEVVHTPRHPDRSSEKRKKTRKSKATSLPPVSPPAEVLVEPLQSPPATQQSKITTSSEPEASAEYVAMKEKFDSLSKKIRTQTTEKHIEPRLATIRSADAADEMSPRGNRTDSYSSSTRKNIAGSDGIPTPRRSDIADASVASVASSRATGRSIVSARSSRGSNASADSRHQLEDRSATEGITPQYLNTGVDHDAESYSAARRSRRQGKGIAGSLVSVPPEVSIPFDSHISSLKSSPNDSTSGRSKNRRSEERLSVSTSHLSAAGRSASKRTPRSSRDPSNTEPHTPPLHPTLSPASATSNPDTPSSLTTANLKSKFAKSPTESISTRPARRVSSNSQRPGESRRGIHE